MSQGQFQSMIFPRTRVHLKHCGDDFPFDVLRLETTKQVKQVQVQEFKNRKNRSIYCRCLHILDQWYPRNMLRYSKRPRSGNSLADFELEFLPGHWYISRRSYRHRFIHQQMQQIGYVSDITSYIRYLVYIYFFYNIYIYIDQLYTKRLVMVLQSVVLPGKVFTNVSLQIKDECAMMVIGSTPWKMCHLSRFTPKQQT